MLFENNIRPANSNDPYMINPKGARVSVPEERVQELLAKGFILEVKDWKPSQQLVSRNYVATASVSERSVPLPKAQLLEEVSAELDLLEVEEI